jgi:hypothetical protein
MNDMRLPCQKGMAPIKRCQVLMVGCQHLVQHFASGAQQEKGCSEMTPSTPLWQKRLRGDERPKTRDVLSGPSFEELQAEEDVLLPISTSLKQGTRPR